MKLFKSATAWLSAKWVWAILFLILIFFLTIFLQNAHRFLAITCRVAEADTLVVEEWSADVVGQAAAKEFKEGKYERLLISCLRKDNDRENDIHNVRKSPEFDRMVSLGIPQERIIVYYIPATENHQSATMAYGVRDALRKGGIKSSGLNVMAPATHARKTWFVHRRALLPETQVGIIAVLPGIYNPDRWWLNSQSAKWVLKNYAGLFYEWITGF